MKTTFCKTNLNIYLAVLSQKIKNKEKELLNTKQNTNFVDIVLF